MTSVKKVAKKATKTVATKAAKKATKTVAKKAAKKAVKKATLVTPTPKAPKVESTPVVESTPTQNDEKVVAPRATISFKDLVAQSNMR